MNRYFYDFSGGENNGRLNMPVFQQQHGNLLATKWLRHLCFNSRHKFLPLLQLWTYSQASSRLYDPGRCGKMGRSNRVVFGTNQIGLFLPINTSVHSLEKIQISLVLIMIVRISYHYNNNAMLTKTFKGYDCKQTLDNL